MNIFLTFSKNKFKTHTKNNSKSKGEIIMEYDEKNHDREMSKSNFVVIIALCLLAIGAITYFAISAMNSNVKEKDESRDNKSYTSDNDSYNSSINEPEFDIPEPSSSVNKTESEIPYEEKPAVEEKKALNFILPVDGNISKGYSDTALQYSATYGDMRLHTGVDILCKTGTDVKSAADGTVVSVEESATLGRVVTVEHYGDITVKYCGFESLNVKESDTVKCGDILGTAGTVPCEVNDQPHIHIEIYQNGEIVSPLDILQNN